MYNKGVNLNVRDRERFKKIIVTSIMFFILGISIDIFYNFCNYNVFAYICNTKNALFSIFFIGLIFLIFLAITKKTWKAFLSVSIVIFIIAFINQLKIIYTDGPLSFTDIYFLSNTSELINIVDESLATSIKLFVPEILVYVLFIISCCIISYYNNINISKKEIRITMFIIPIVIFIFLFVPNKFINTNLLNIVFDADERKDYSRSVSEKAELVANGVISGMYQQLLENRLFEPENYDEEIVEKNLYNIPNIEDNSFGTPNIIVLFAESFWDIDLLEEIQFDKKITANFTELKKSGIFFDMITPYLEEPTLIVFFGDHLPYLKTSKGENILDHLEYFNTNDELLNTYRQYNTQALILSNYELENEEKEYLSPNLLGTYILNKMDINISPYYKWLNNCIDIMPSANWYVAIDNNRKFYYTNTLNGFLKEQYHLREYIQYYHFFRK